MCIYVINCCRQNKLTSAMCLVTVILRRTNKVLQIDTFGKDAECGNAMPVLLATLRLLVYHEPLLNDLKVYRFAGISLQHLTDVRD